MKQLQLLLKGVNQQKHVQNSADAEGMVHLKFVDNKYNEGLRSRL